MSDPLATPTSARQSAVPTNVITYNGRQIPARIDTASRLGYIIEIMAQSFNAPEHHVTLCLRDEADELVTQATLIQKIRAKEMLKLTLAPATDAHNVVTSLKDATQPEATPSSSKTDVMPLKLALFNMSKYIKEEEFAVEFMLHSGPSMLMSLVERTDGGLTGNSLAYALQGIRGILEFEAGWDEITPSFIDRCLALLMSATQPNVLRPATAIARKLVISSPHLDHRRSMSKAKGKGKEGAEAKDPQTLFGFAPMFARMKAAPVPTNGPEGGTGFLRMIAKRLESPGDLELVAQSLGLLNACLRSAYRQASSQYQELVEIYEQLKVRGYVSRLIPISAGNVVEPHILNFQARYTAILQHKRLRSVQTGQYPEHEKMLADIWKAGRLGLPSRFEEPALETKVLKAADPDVRTRQGWKRLGLGLDLDPEEEQSPLSETELFRNTGELGLHCLHHFASRDDDFHMVVIEQDAREPDKRCPIGKASAECVKILCEYYKVSQAGHHAPTVFQLFLLSFDRLHDLLLRFFLRMWKDSLSCLADFDRLAVLIRYQVKWTLKDEASKSWLNLEKDFLEPDYRSIRERQMQAMEKESGLYNKPSVKILRDKLNKESYEMLADQRVGCMLQGAWFNACMVTVPGIISSSKALSAKPLKFVILSPSRHTLAWGEFSERPKETPTFASLRERVDLANMTDLRLKTGCAVNARSPNIISRLSFSLMSGPELSLLDLDAVHSAQLAEWTDGIRVLKGTGSMITAETANYVHIMTELSLKIRLLDITGDGIELPDRVTVGRPPSSTDFWFN